MTDAEAADTVLDVTTVVAGGDGLAREVGGRVVFVAGALPGERVRVAVHDGRKDYARARILEVVVASPDREAEPCPFVAEGCGGCDWQHVAPAAQRRLKALMVADALRRQAHLEVEVGLGPDLSSTRYRTTVRGVAVDGRFGFRRRGSHDQIPVAPCLIAHPILHELIDEGRFPDGEIVLRAGARTGERLVVVHGDDVPTSLPADVRVVSAAQLRSGARAWYHEEVAGRRWRVSARSFFQARPDGADALVDEVRAALGAPGPAATLVDLYAGVGLFAGALDGFAQVTAVEHGRSSIADARVNLANRSARIVRSDVAHWGPTHAAAVVADPPRAGLGKAGVGKVVATRAERLALVSCDPAALGRDACLLEAAGFRLTRCTLVDLFPQTSHVEVVSAFERG